MNKREVVLSVLDDAKSAPYIPAGFFIHFDPSFHRGATAIGKHMEFFHYTGMDFVKIQYENRFPERPEIIKAEDWYKMPYYNEAVTSTECSTCQYKISTFKTHYLSPYQARYPHPARKTNNYHNIKYVWTYNSYYR